MAVYTEATERSPMDQPTISSLGVLGSSLQLLLLQLPFYFAFSFIDPEFLNPFDVCCPRVGVVLTVRVSLTMFCVCGCSANLYCKLTTGEMFVETRVEHVSCGGESAEGIPMSRMGVGRGGADRVQSEDFISENPVFVSK